MRIAKTCPSCGLESDDVRCPRCFALKVIGCSGSCGSCAMSCAASDAATCAPGADKRPSDQAVEDAEHPGTPLER